MRHLIAIIVTNLQIQWFYDTTARTKDSMPHRVSADNWRCLAQSISLEHRHTYGAEIALQLDIQQRSTAYEEAHPTAESLAYSFEDDLVKQFHQRPSPCLPSAAIPILLIIFNGIIQRKLIQSLHRFALGLDAALDALAEVTR